MSKKTTSATRQTDAVIPGTMMVGVENLAVINETVFRNLREHAAMAALAGLIAGNNEYPMREDVLIEKAWALGEKFARAKPAAGDKP